MESKFNKNGQKMDTFVDTNKKRERQIEKKKNHSELTYYEILCVSENATPAEIKNNFRKLAKDFHPDNQAKGDARLFALVAKAYECLSDAKSKNDYDAKLLSRKKEKLAQYDNLRNDFDEFIKAQESAIQNDKTGKLLEDAKNKFKLEFEDRDRKIGIDRDQYEFEKSNPLTAKETRKTLEERLIAREQEDIELTQKNLFEGESFDINRFNKMFEMKYKNSNFLTKHQEHPSAFNNNYNSDPFSGTNNDDIFDDSHVATGLYSSLDILEGDNVEITDDDIRKMKSFDLKQEVVSKNPEDLMKKLRQRDIEDKELYNRKLSDFDTDNKLYKFSHEIGMLENDDEYDFDDLELDNNTVNKLLNYRNNNNDMINSLHQHKK